MATTRITVQLENPAAESVFLRGEGVPGLNWDKGIKMQRIADDEWVFETQAFFSNGFFKVLLDDHTYEAGENHPLSAGSSVRINPKFPAKRVS